MKQGKRKLQLDRTTIRPLAPQQLRHVAGGTGDSNDQSEGYNDSDLLCDGSLATNLSKDVAMCASR